MTAPEPKQALAADLARERDDPAAYVLEDQIGFVLRKAHQRASEMFNQVMGRFDVTPTQFAILAKLDDLGACSQATLGRFTAMDPATVLGVITRLKTRGYVAQRRDLTDKRRILLTLTTAGQNAVAEMKAVAAEVSARTLAPLSAEEGQVLCNLLTRLQAAKS